MGKKLTLYLIDGTDTGPRTIEIGNWSGKAIHTPRAGLLTMMERTEYDNPGVYILKSDPQEDIYNERIYIGESENVKKRLKQHLRDSDRDFKECIIFVSKDELLTKSHIKYIEARLIDIAVKASNSEIENGNQPNQNSLSEADISDMEYFIEQIKIILPTVGYNFMLSSTVHKVNEKNEASENSVVFRIRGRKVNARMHETAEGFVVLKGSEAVLTATKSINNGWLKMRQKLIKSGTLIEDNAVYKFTEDTIFNSTSAAAAIILGRQAAGPIEWIDDNRKSYKEYENERLESIPENPE